MHHHDGSQLIRSALLSAASRASAAGIGALHSGLRPTVVLSQARGSTTDLLKLIAWAASVHPPQPQRQPVQLPLQARLTLQPSQKSQVLEQRCWGQQQHPSQRLESQQQQLLQQQPQH